MLFIINNNYFRIFIDYSTDIIKYSSPTPDNNKSKVASHSKAKDQYTITSRPDQTIFRNKVLANCQYYPFTMVNDERLLIASYIKPYAKSNEKERKDYKNGFALTHTYDRLFDQGFISFDSQKRLMVSPWISPMNLKNLNIHEVN